MSECITKGSLNWKQLLRLATEWRSRNVQIAVARTHYLLTMTPGEDDASYRGTQIGGELHDTLAISDGHTRRKDDDTLRRFTVCVEIVIPADMNCTKVEINDMTILRQRLPWRQDSAEHDECYISVSNTAAEFNDVVFRRRRLPRTEVFAESVEEKCIAPRTDSVSAEQNDLTFRRPKSPFRSQMVH